MRLSSTDMDRNRKEGRATMTNQPTKKSGITNAPLEEEEDQQDKVPARGESIQAKAIMVHSVCTAIGPSAVPGRPLCSGDYLRAS